MEEEGVAKKKERVVRFFSTLWRIKGTAIGLSRHCRVQVGERAQRASEWVMLYSLFAPALRGLWPPVRASQLELVVRGLPMAHTGSFSLRLSLSLSLSLHFFDFPRTHPRSFERDRCLIERKWCVICHRHRTRESFGSNKIDADR